MRIVREIRQLDTDGCVLVPTMGALHAGHLSLVERAREVSGPKQPIVVSIFVNPTQFNVQADLDAYPRNIEKDLDLLRDNGVDIAFCPTVEEMYPRDTPVGVPPLPLVAYEPALEDEGRPGHFAGVCQVVSRLFDVCRPHAAVFGEKDWQQLQVVRSMVRMQKRPIVIIAGPIVREQDGLALSSRNARLSATGRNRALSLKHSLDAARECARYEYASCVLKEVLGSHTDRVWYATIRDAETLMPIRDETRPKRALVCAEVEGVRLLDNSPWP